MTTKDTTVLLLDQQSDKPRWLCFREPVEILQTVNPAEVLPCLGMIDERVAAGFYAAGYIGYEAASGLDPALETHSVSGIPCLWFGIFKHYEETELPVVDDDKPFSFSDWKPSISPDRYNCAIEQIKHHIYEGDSYQVNYTFRLKSTFEGDPLQLFAWLHRGQQSRYSAFIDLGRYKICSVSPELFVSLNGEIIVSKPMKGTLPRGYTLEQDRRDSDSLYGSAKDRAENLMIVDMIRNDIGRIAASGSVAVPKLFEVEKYPTVQQMTSTVSARTSVPASKIFGAMFPCASITGAPKIETMRIIKELEPDSRGVYTGSIGYIAPNRQMQFNVAIRTVLLDTKNAEAEYGVGGGVTWYSDARSEYRECCAKASVLTRAYPEFKLLESILWDDRHGYYLLDRHLGRLKSSAEYFEFDISIAEIKRRLEAAQSAYEKGRRKIRLLVDGDGKITVDSAALTGMPGTRIGISPVPINTHTPFVYHKTTYRRVYDDILSAKREDEDDLVFWNKDGFVTETGIANVVIDDGTGRLITPPVDCGLLAGVQRSRLLQQNIIHEEAVTLDALKNAPAVYLINSVRGWMRLRKETGDRWVVIGEELPEVNSAS